MRGTVQFDGSCSHHFPIRNGMKQGCVLAPTLLGIFFSLLLSYAFRESDDGVFIHTRPKDASSTWRGSERRRRYRGC